MALAWGDRKKHFGFFSYCFGFLGAQSESLTA